jgi:hypothetical protein
MIMMIILSRRDLEWNELNCIGRIIVSRDINWYEMNSRKKLTLLIASLHQIELSDAFCGSVPTEGFELL